MLERIKDPLQTLISRDNYETAYTVLTNFLLIVHRAPVIFSQVRRSRAADVASQSAESTHSLSRCAFQHCAYCLATPDLILSSFQSATERLRSACLLLGSGLL